MGANGHLKDVGGTNTTLSLNSELNGLGHLGSFGTETTVKHESVVDWLVQGVPEAYWVYLRAHYLRLKLKLCGKMGMLKQTWKDKTFLMKVLIPTEVEEYTNNK